MQRLSTEQIWKRWAIALALCAAGATAHASCATKTATLSPQENKWADGTAICMHQGKDKPILSTDQKNPQYFVCFTPGNDDQSNGPNNVVDYTKVVVTKWGPMIPGVCTGKGKPNYWPGGGFPCLCRWCDSTVHNPSVQRGSKIAPPVYLTATSRVMDIGATKCTWHPSTGRCCR